MDGREVTISDISKTWLPNALDILGSPSKIAIEG